MSEISGGSLARGHEQRRFWLWTYVLWYLINTGFCFPIAVLIGILFHLPLLGRVGLAVQMSLIATAILVALKARNSHRPGDL